jgi:hypothetical protein
MIKIFSILLGSYIVADAIYLAATSGCNERNIIIAKYVFAFMSGLYLVASKADGELLFMGATIALFMLPETLYRILSWLEYNHSMLYSQYFKRVDIFSRRRIDR